MVSGLQRRAGTSQGLQCPELQRTALSGNNRDTLRTNVCGIRPNPVSIRSKYNDQHLFVSLLTLVNGWKVVFFRLQNLKWLSGIMSVGGNCNQCGVQSEPGIFAHLKWKWMKYLCGGRQLIGEGREARVGWKCIPCILASVHSNSSHHFFFSCFSQGKNRNKLPSISELFYQHKIPVPCLENDVTAPLLLLSTHSIHTIEVTNNLWEKIIFKNRYIFYLCYLLYFNILFFISNYYFPTVGEFVWPLNDGVCGGLGLQWERTLQAACTLWCCSTQTTHGEISDSMIT